MSVESLSASKAYAQAALKAAQDVSGKPGENEKSGQTFGAFVDNYIKDAVELGNASETQMISSLANQTELVDVVTAITAAEVTLETVVAVRDKVIEAYESIMRMPI